MTSLKKPPFDFKTQYALGFNSQDDEIVVDFFCRMFGSPVTPEPVTSSCDGRARAEGDQS